jgi:16S rRNA processing protein RimM
MASAARGFASTSSTSTVTEPSGAPDDPAEAPIEYVAIGRIGRAHGLRGEVSVESWTDDPRDRFSPGIRFRTEGGEPAELTVLGAKLHGGRWLVAFEGIEDRNASEAVRGLRLMMPAHDRPAIEDPDEFYDTDLVGLIAVTPAGVAMGTTTDVVHGAAGDFLVLLVPAAGGVPEREHLVPFVAAIVPSVDIVAGLVVIDAPDGLLDL